MLRAVPKSWLSWDFTVLENGERVADIDVAWVREAGELSIRGVSCNRGTLTWR